MDPSSSPTTALDPVTMATLATIIGDAVAKAVSEVAERIATAPLRPLLVDINGVRALTGFSKATVYRMLAEDLFPQPVGCPGTMWRTADLDRWAAKLKSR